MIEKIKTFLWFSYRPFYWLHMANLILRKFQKDLDSDELRLEATTWASNLSVTTEEALKKIGIMERDQDLVFSIEPDLIERAKVLAKKSSVQMGGEGSLELIYASTILIDANTAIETGVAYGWSSLAFLSALRKKESSKLISVDMPYPKLNNEEFVGIVVPKDLRSGWYVISEPDRNGLKKAIKKAGGAVDICHYDSDKSYQGRNFAYPLLWKSLRKGGIFISDDIQDNFAFKEFVESNGLNFAVTEHQDKFIGIIKK